jgi:prepilin-type N-terminal cleavage/methylation domain-containing protein
MNGSPKSRRVASRAGFTLIELLTVIVIIGVLAGMISSAVLMSKRRALDLRRETELKTIKSAIENYRYEYQQWPCEGADLYPLPPSVTYSNDNYKIKNWMDARDGNDNNTRKIRFINIGDYKTNSVGSIVDYKGNPYEITISFTNDKVTIN